MESLRWRSIGPTESTVLADFLNQHCHCLTVDRASLESALIQGGGATAAQNAHLFAQSPVFVDAQEVAEIEQLVRAVHQLTRLEPFRRHALEQAGDLAGLDPGNRGILHGFDFHMTDAGPRLIEVNTNAGGALLNVALASVQASCCAAARPFVDSTSAAAVQAALVEGFREEFRAVRGSTAVLSRVAIVDEAPEQQFLFREFELFRALFSSHGIQAEIADPSELEHRNGALWLRGAPVDLVYNRLTDFYLEGAASRQLRAAYSKGDVVLTPHPRAHALLANKRHLASFCQPESLRNFGATDEVIEVLTRITPYAELVREEDRERLHRERKQLFFKPLAGYGGKATYRGDKLTRTKFDEILRGEYLAQRIVAPSERSVELPQRRALMKMDVRAYVVSERVMLLAARLYQGQTTNFRTPGGGFAAVLALSRPEGIQAA